MTENKTRKKVGLARFFVDKDPFIYLHSDIIYEDNILKNCLSSEPNALVVDEDSIDAEAMKVLHSGGKLREDLDQNNLK